MSLCFTSVVLASQADHEGGSHRPMQELWSQLRVPADPNGVPKANSVYQMHSKRTRVAQVRELWPRLQVQRPPATCPGVRMPRLTAEEH